MELSNKSGLIYKLTTYQIKIINSNYENNINLSIQRFLLQSIHSAIPLTTIFLDPSYIANLKSLQKKLFI